MREIAKLAKAFKFLCDVTGKKDIPMYWGTFLLIVAEAGELGITTKEVSEAIDMTQGIASRTVKLMSKFYNPATKEVDGLDLLVALNNDMHYRQRQRVYLTDHGKQVVEQLKKILK